MSRRADGGETSNKNRIVDLPRKIAPSVRIRDETRRVRVSFFTSGPGPDVPGGESPGWTERLEWRTRENEMRSKVGGPEVVRTVPHGRHP